jgi:hypothetical protein
MVLGKEERGEKELYSPMGLGGYSVIYWMLDVTVTT